MAPTQENPLARYTILRELGRGAVGTVYAARDGSTGVVVALKVLDPALCSEPNARLAERFLENARAAARLRHRNIVRILEAGEASPTAFVAMELVEGESLRRVLDGRPLSIARAIQVFDDIASALAYAHEEGMVHRGVKPSNIIVLPSGVAKIGDFGLGQIGDAALPYMSPEQARRDPVDHRSDLFSLGIVFYEMLTRRAPIVQAEPPAPSKVNPHVPVALDAIVSRLLARHADERFSNARLVLRDLQRVEEELGLGPGAGADARPRARIDEPAQPLRVIEPTLPAPVRISVEPEPDGRFLKEREPRPESSSGSRAAFVAALALMLAVLSIGLSVVLYYSPDLIERLADASGIRQQRAPATAAAPPPPTAPAPVAEAIVAPAPVAEAIVEPATPPAIPEPLPPQPLVEEPEEAAIGETAPTQEAQEAPPPAPPPPAAPPRAKVAQPQPGAMATLILTVLPRGELYVDGEHYGSTPPITTLELAPGLHQIEVRSGSRKPFVTYMTVKPGEERRIRHDFGAKPSRPPG